MGIESSQSATERGSCLLGMKRGRGRTSPTETPLLAMTPRIIHRDLKPSNIFLTHRPDGCALVKVTDFGLAKWTGETRGDLTSSQVILGSPGYMAPEQLRNPRTVDTRADIWSLGAVLYELLTGRPYEATTLVELVARVLTEPRRPLPPSLPPALARIVERCLEREPGSRYATVHELAAVLVPFGSSAARELARRVRQIASARPEAAVPLCAADTLDVAQPNTVESPRSTGVSRWSLAAIGVLGAIALTLLVAVIIKNAHRETRPTQQATEVVSVLTATSLPPPPAVPVVEVIPLEVSPPAPADVTAYRMFDDRAAEGSRTGGTPSSMHPIRERAPWRWRRHRALLPPQATEHGTSSRRREMTRPAHCRRDS